VFVALGWTSRRLARGRCAREPGASPAGRTAMRARRWRRCPAAGRSGMSLSAAVPGDGRGADRPRLGGWACSWSTHASRSPQAAWPGPARPLARGPDSDVRFPVPCWAGIQLLEEALAWV